MSKYEDMNAAWENLKEVAFNHPCPSVKIALENFEEFFEEYKNITKRYIE